jgi:hypothetical protein
VKSLLANTLLIVLLPLFLSSCNRHLVSEEIRSGIENIDWNIDSSTEVIDHSSSSSGGTASIRSSYSHTVSLSAPKGFTIPENTVNLYIDKVRTTIKAAGGEVIRATKESGIHYTKHSDNHDASAYTFKVVYKADGYVGVIIGVLNKRRIIDKYSNKEIVGQVLLTLHEERI